MTKLFRIFNFTACLVLAVSCAPSGEDGESTGTLDQPISGQLEDPEAGGPVVGIPVVGDPDAGDLIPGDPGTGDPGAGDPGAGTPPFTTANVYRFYNIGIADHFLTLNENEGLQTQGYISEGIAFQVISNEIQGVTQPLYRCLSSSNGNHFVSLNSNCEGFTFEGMYGHVLINPDSNLGVTTPIYRCYHSGIQDHLTTTSDQECINSSYGIEGIQGYVPDI